MNAGRRFWLGSIVLGSLVASGCALDPIVYETPVWTGDVAPLAAFVEAAHGQPFKTPVFVDILPEADYDALERTQEAQRCETDACVAARKEWESDTQLLGLPVATESSSAASDEAFVTLGFYDSFADRIVVRGAVANDQVRATLVHELTHAWQDQHYETWSEEDDPDESLARRSVLESDAMRIEDLWLASLAADRRKAYDDAVNADQSGPPKLSDDAAAAAFNLAVFPYTHGRLFMALQVAADPGAPDRLLAAKSLTTWDILDGAAPPNGIEISGSGRRVGGARWLQALVNRLPERNARLAVAQIVDDSLVVINESCRQATFVLRKDANRPVVERALAQWAYETYGKAQAELRRQEGRLVLKMCGTAASPEPDLHSRLLRLIRADALVVELANGRNLPIEKADCLVSKVLAQDPDLVDGNVVEALLAAENLPCTSADVVPRTAAKKPTPTTTVRAGLGELAPVETVAELAP